MNFIRHLFGVCRERKKIWSQKAKKKRKSNELKRQNKFVETALAHGAGEEMIDEIKFIYPSWGNSKSASFKSCRQECDRVIQIVYLNAINRF